MHAVGRDSREGLLQVSEVVVEGLAEDQRPVVLHTDAVEVALL